MNCTHKKGKKRRNQAPLPPPLKAHQIIPSFITPFKCDTYQDYYVNENFNGWISNVFSSVSTDSAVGDLVTVTYHQPQESCRAKALGEFTFAKLRAVFRIRYLFLFSNDSKQYHKFF